MQRTAGGSDRGIVGNHFDSALHRAFQSRHQRVRIVGGDCDGIDVLGDERVDDFDLALCGGSGRPGEDDLDAELAGGFVGALVYGVEESIAQGFGDDADAQLGARGVLLQRLWRAAQPPRGRRRRCRRP